MSIPLGDQDRVFLLSLAFKQKDGRSVAAQRLLEWLRMCSSRAEISTRLRGLDKIAPSLSSEVRNLALQLDLGDL